MARSIAVLGTECRTEGIDLAQCCCAKFTLKLTTHGETCHFAKEVVVIGNLAVLVFLQVIEVLGCHLEHLACSFTIARSDKRCVEIEKATVVEELVNGNRHVVADAEHGTKGIGAQTQMRILTHILKALSLLLHGIVASTRAINFDALALYLHGLSLSLAFYQFTYDMNAGTCGHLL